METVRLRLVFDHILSKLQNAQGLKRCWILLKPQHQTISDLSSYILDAFNLQNHCPHGLLLSMEGFALPGFESTTIFKDKDIIRVENNGEVSSEIVMIEDAVDNTLEVVEVLDEQPAGATDLNLLANEEFEKQSGGYRNEEEEDMPEQEQETVHVESKPEAKTVSKKRKATKELKISKRKKTKSASAVKRAVVVEDKGKNVCGEQNGTSTPKVNKGESTKVLSKAKRFSQPQGNGDASVDASPSTCGTEKGPSRSARRKKAKRRWLREKLRAEREEQHQRQLHGNSAGQQTSDQDNKHVSQVLAEKGHQDISEELPERESGKLQEDNGQADADSDLEDDIVPIMIKPGHIRFQPLSKAGATDQAMQQPQIPVETFQWNGITSKKKGQKWGKEKATSSKMNAYKHANQECSEMQNGAARPEFDQIDFEKLEFYTTLPKEGDIIAYRLIELSSSWTPELSSYQVGKISRYDMDSNKVMLVPIPGYPVISETGNDESSIQSEVTHYAEDGSLWIEFSSLVEVRIFTKVDSNSMKSSGGGVDEVSFRDHDDNVTGFQPNNGNESQVPLQENGKVNAWEDTSQVQNAKKVAQAQEDNWKKAESSGRNRWSYKALRGSALGPTMALLRSQNEL